LCNEIDDEIGLDYKKELKKGRLKWIKH
jgi:hypothetical protein